MLTEVRACLGAELERLNQELVQRMTIDPRVAPGGEADQVASDLHRALQGKIRFFGNLVAGLAGADPSTIAADHIGYGSTVTVREVATGSEEVYTLVPGDFLDLEQGHVSLASPMGHALIGRRAGERVRVLTPRGERRYDITAMVTLPQRLGLVPTDEIRPGLRRSLQIA